MLRGLLCLLTLIISSPVIVAATDDSTTAQKTYRTVLTYFNEQDFSNGNIVWHAPDSSVYGIDRVNPALTRHYNYLGTAGSAASPQEFPVFSSPYTRTINRSYDLQLLTTDDLVSYRVNKRFTELRYHSGAFKEQRIVVMHTQNVTRNWNAGLLFDRQGTRDFMNFSNTFRSRFALFTTFHTPDKKYYLFSDVLWNRIKNSVNGGLSSDSLFDNTTVSNLGIKGLAYNISGASNNRRNRTLYLSQYYSPWSDPDSSRGPAVLRAGITLHHLISYERNSFVSLDDSPDSAYYANFYYGPETRDSAGADELKNRFELILKPGNGAGIPGNSRVSIFAEYIHTHYRQRLDSNWNNLAIGAKAKIEADSTSASIFVEGTYVATGLDKKNYSFAAVLTSPVWNFGQFSLTLGATRRLPELFLRVYEGNNFIWYNDFSPVKSLTGSLAFLLPRHDLEIAGTLSRISGYTYLDTNAMPSQYNEDLNVTKVKVLKNFTFGKWHFSNALVFQETNREEVLHLPAWFTDQSLYLEKTYFKSALLLALGISANFNSAYYADAFMPSTALFYLQKEKKTGGYVRFDIFANAKIKTARLFLRMENALDNLVERSYYLVPHYPMPGRVLKFGVVWWFLDQ